MSTKLITKEGVISMGDFPRFASGAFGAGTDGIANFNGGAVNGTSFASPNYTLTRNVFYTTATIAAGFNVITNGFKIYCSGTLQLNAPTSVIASNGLSGSNASGVAFGPGGTAAAPPTVSDPGVLTPGGNGGNGTSGAGSGSPGNSPSGPIAPTFGGIGGAGGAGGTGGAGSGGGPGSTEPTAGSYSAFRGLSSPILALTGMVNGGGGGAGGGGAGSTAGATGGGGGGGGAGGGVVMVFASTINSSGKITANGGTGGNGANGSAIGAGGGGSGGGGGGGVVCLVYSAPAALGVLEVNGGAAGTPGTGISPGVMGITGAAGKAGTILKFNTSKQIFE